MGADQPQWIGDYRLDQKLGKGAMGTVYRVWRRDGQGPFALKLLHPETLDDSRALKRFVNEGRSMAALREHPGIVGVLDMGMADEGPFVVMDYVEGATLRDLLKQGALSERQALEHVASVVDALAYAHDRGFVHRDVKPENVLVTKDGRALLSDFGVTRVLGGLEDLTRTGELLGTPAYMAPEQVSSDLGAVGPAIDVYAIGVLLYQLLCGRSPYEATSSVVLLSQLLNGDPFPRPRELRPRLNPVWEDVILGALERDPKRRFANAAELAEELELALAGPLEGGGARRRVAASLSALVVLLALVGAGLALRARRGGAGATPADSPQARLGAAEVQAELRARWEADDFAGLARLCEDPARRAAARDDADRYAELARAGLELERARTDGSWDRLRAKSEELLREREPEARLAARARACLGLALLHDGSGPRAARAALGPPPHAEVPWLGLLLAAGGDAKAALSRWPTDYLPASRARVAAWAGDAASARAALGLLPAGRAAALAADLGLVDEGATPWSPASAGWEAIAAGRHAITRGAPLLAQAALGGAALDRSQVSDPALRLAACLLEAQAQLAACEPVRAEEAWREGEAVAAQVEDDPLLVVAWRVWGARALGITSEAAAGWAPLVPALAAQDVESELALARAGQAGAEGALLLDCWDAVDAACAGGDYDEDLLGGWRAALDRLRRGALPHAASAAWVRLRLLQTGLGWTGLGPLLQACDACGQGAWAGRLRARALIAQAREEARELWVARLAQGRAAGPERVAELRVQLATAINGLRAAARATRDPALLRALRLEQAAACLEREQLGWLTGPADGQPGERRAPPRELVDDLEELLAELLAKAPEAAVRAAHRAYQQALRSGQDLRAPALDLARAAAELQPETLSAWWLRARCGDRDGLPLLESLRAVLEVVPCEAALAARAAEVSGSAAGLEAWPAQAAPLLAYRRWCSAPDGPREPRAWAELAVAVEVSPDLFPLLCARARALTPAEAAALTDATTSRLGAALVGAARGGAAWRQNYLALSELHRELPTLVLPELAAAELLLLPEPDPAARVRRSAAARAHLRRARARRPDVFLPALLGTCDPQAKDELARLRDWEVALGHRPAPEAPSATAFAAVAGYLNGRNEHPLRVVLERGGARSILATWRALYFQDGSPPAPLDELKIPPQDASTTVVALARAEEAALTGDLAQATRQALRVLAVSGGGGGPLLPRLERRVARLLPQPRYPVEQAATLRDLPALPRLGAAMAGALDGEAEALRILSAIAGPAAAPPSHPFSLVLADALGRCAPQLVIEPRGADTAAELAARLLLAADARPLTPRAVREVRLARFAISRLPAAERAVRTQELLLFVARLQPIAAVHEPMLDLVLDAWFLSPANRAAIQPALVRMPEPARPAPGASPNAVLLIYLRRARRELALSGAITPESAQALGPLIVQDAARQGEGWQPGFAEVSAALGR
ncbi:MAG: protein kinase [Planctomycetota bacterium]